MATVGCHGGPKLLSSGRMTGPPSEFGRGSKGAFCGWQLLPGCAITLRPSSSSGRHSQVVRRGSAKPLFPGSNPGAASNFPLIVHQSGPAPAPGRRAIESGALALSRPRRAAARRVLRSSRPSHLPMDRSPDSQCIRPRTTACAHSRSGATRCVRDLMPNALHAFRH